jgi:hypothetical protein
MKKKILLLLLVSAVLFGCKSRTKSESNESQSLVDTITQNTSDAIFSDDGVSSFYIFSGNDYKTVEVNYKVVYIIPDGYKKLGNYIAKYTTTTKVKWGEEGQDRNIKVELYDFENPSKLVMKIDKNCDELNLLIETYKTTIYGCCGAEENYEIFDYKHKSIIRADNQIILGEIPNPRIRFYVGFEQDFVDTLSLGLLNYSYNSNEKFTIKIRTRRNLEKDFLPFSPDIEILGGNDDKKSSEQSLAKYTFWSLNNKIRDKNSINNLTIRLTFPCENEAINNVIDIPIINGKPFGKEETTQEIYIIE